MSGITYAELILHKIDCVFMQFIKKRPRLFFAQMFEASLKNAAPVGVGRQLVDVASERVHEGQAIRGYALDQLLNDL